MDSMSPSGAVETVAKTAGRTVARVDTFVVEAGWRNFLIVKITTSDGIVGWGDGTLGWKEFAVEALVREFAERYLVGRDPFRIEDLWFRLYQVEHNTGPVMYAAMAGLETALWDIVGKACGQPLVNLFGGPVRDRVEFFWYLSRRSPAQVAADAERAVKAGFRTLYLKVGSDNPADDIERVEAVRDGAGPDALIRVDANEAWSSAAAIRIVRELERFGLELVEQPVSGRNLPEMAYVRGRINSPLLANEASWTRHDQLEVIRHGAADVLSVDNQMDGGLLNLKRSAGLCEVAGLPVLKHSLGELGVAVYAAVHVMASTPNFVCANQSYASFLADDVLADASPLPYKDGCLAVPHRPGIGVDLDLDRVAKYAELYERQGRAFAFHEPAALAATPVIPKF